MSNPQTEPARLGKRTCRACGREYRAPIGARRPGCPTCYPSILDEPLEPDLRAGDPFVAAGCTCEVLFPGGPPPPVHAPECPLYDGIPF